MSQHRSFAYTAVIGLVVACSLLAGCAPLTPQRSLDRKPQAERDAAARIPVFKPGSEAPPSATVIGPLEAHSCQFWEFADPASVEDAILRLQFAAIAAGADGVIDVSQGKDEGNRWASRCWDSYVVRGTAVKFSGPLPVAAAPASTAVEAAAPTPAPAGTATTIIASGEGRPELMDWVRRLAIPRGSFIARGPGDGNLDWIGVDAEIGAWQVRLPKATGAAAAGSKLTDSGIALVPGVSRLSLSTRQLGYTMSASWTYTVAGSWDMADQLLQRQP